MKTILALSILFSVIALPALGELTAEDWKRYVRSSKASETALKSDIEKTNSKLDAIDTRLRQLKQVLRNYGDVTLAFQPPKIGSLPSVLWLQSSSLLSLYGKHNLKRHRPHRTPPRPCLSKEHYHVFYVFNFHLIDYIYRFDSHLHQGIRP